jgi:hypothetical protein
MRTMKRWCPALLAVAIAASPSSAQEISVPDYQGQYADSLLHSRLTGRMIRQAQERQRRRDAGTPARRAAGEPISARSHAICQDRQRLARRLPREKAVQLYALCARAGYRS